MNTTIEKIDDDFEPGGNTGTRGCDALPDIAYSEGLAAKAPQVNTDQIAEEVVRNIFTWFPDNYRTEQARKFSEQWVKAAIEEALIDYDSRDAYNFGYERGLHIAKQFVDMKAYADHLEIKLGQELDRADKAAVRAELCQIELAKARVNLSAAHTSEQLCECGHPVKEHRREKDHDECTVNECECDRIRLKPAHASEESRAAYDKTL